MERRKDTKGRVLKEGESQRKDGRYQYRWVDATGKRQCIYAADLKTLRSKQDEIREAERRGMHVITSDMTVMELVCKFVELHKISVKENTIQNSYTFIRALRKYPFAEKSISSVTIGDGKLFIVNLYIDGYAYGTIEIFKITLRQAFEFACDDKLILENPFRFSLPKVIRKEEKEKVILTEAQYERLLDFCQQDKQLVKYIDEVIVLHETGLRVSEFCGLTINDLDFEQNVIRVDHQLLYFSGRLSIDSPKTKQGIRTIPMSAKAKKAFEHMLELRPALDEEPKVDGRSGFLQIGPHGKPRRAASVESNVRKMIAKYNKANPQDMMPPITPHSFRHMFCTRLIRSGMNIKAVQYIMGHKKIEMTLEVYSHMDEENAITAFREYAALQ